MRAWILSLVWTAVLSAIIHVAAVWAVPRVTMGQVLDGLSSEGVNVARRPVRADATLRKGGNPTPDILYTRCVYDVGREGLVVEATVPASYWSMIVYGSDSRVFFETDSIRSTGKVKVLIVSEDSFGNKSAPPGVTLLRVPTDRGLILFRTLVDSEESFADMRYAQQQITCTAAP
jgi:uncharacterized membrane protein